MITLKKHNYGGIMKPPASKSDGHRALICAAMAKGVSKISNIYYSDDIIATIKSLKALGARFDIDGDEVTVCGISSYQEAPVLDCGESGSTLRFLMPLATAVSSSPSFLTKGRLSQRPLDVYEKIYHEQNIILEKNKNVYSVSGKLKNGDFIVDGSVSSQFISGLLFTLPLLKGDSKIIIQNKMSSLYYIYMSISLLKKFGIEIDFSPEEQIIYVKGNQEYHPQNYTVENDFSQASFILALGALTTLTEVTGMNMGSFQPDKAIVPILQKMGVTIETENGVIKASKSKIRGCTIDLDANPDLGPVLMGIASFADKDVTFNGIKRLRIKESDRVEAMRSNLEKLGVNMEIVSEDTCIVHPGKLKETNEILCSFNDHRIFMALAVICNGIDITIDDEKCINKSWPTFLDDLKKLQLEE